MCFLALLVEVVPSLVHSFSPKLRTVSLVINYTYKYVPLYLGVKLKFYSSCQTEGKAGTPCPPYLGLPLCLPLFDHAVVGLTLLAYFLPVNYCFFRHRLWWQGRLDQLFQNCVFLTTLN